MTPACKTRGERCGVGDDRALSFNGEHAPGAPGMAPTWTSSAKDTVGCTLGSSRLWFTLGYGIVNEVYYPRIDIPQIRDLGFIVADGEGFWVEIKRLGRYELHFPGPGIPAAQVVHRHERFTLSLRITPDSVRDVLLVEVDLQGDAQLRVYAVIAPHLGGTGYDNIAEAAEYRGQPVLWAEQGPFGLALAAADARQRNAWQRTSVGYVGASDGWQDFSRYGTLRQCYRSAGPGNVAAVGELPRYCVLALGFGSSKESAATLAVSALLQPFDEPWGQQIEDWRHWHADNSLRCRFHGELAAPLRDQLQLSAMVLRAHQDKTYPGAMVASLSIPWGNSRNERGGYHLVWPRDLVESAGALLALGANEEARNVLRYLITTQHADGHWYQNQWLGGKPYWLGIQLDEAAFPVLLAAMLDEREALDGIDAAPMVRLALQFIVSRGPASDQDRWEENAGVNTFTLAVCIAALVAGSRFLDSPARELALAIADFWNRQIESWTAVYDTTLARRLGVNGYYLRVAPPQAIVDEQALHRSLPVKNRIDDPGLPADEYVATDFLQLVRSGLRGCDDGLIVDTLKVVDALLRIETPAGPAWRRYNGDGYGERDDGSPFNGHGRGRAWPLLAGERGHYELQAGNDPLSYLQAMAAMSGRGGMLPEQVWDSEPLPGRALFPGRPSGSAMPLVWAHAEFIKLLASRALGRPFDRVEAVWQRYQGRRPTAADTVWCPHAPVGRVVAGGRLLICLPWPATARWGRNGWREVTDSAAGDRGLGLYVAELPVDDMAPGQRIDFTWRRTDTGDWAGRDYGIEIVGAD
jgi:glucoamylase